MIRVLLVDDEPLALEYFSKLVDWNTLGFSIVATASNGKQAFRLYEQLHPEVIISDIKMPVMDGLDLVSQLGENNVIVIFLSSYDDPQYTIGAINEGVYRYWLKHNLNAQTLMEHLEKLRVFITKRKNETLYQYNSQISEILLTGEKNNDLIPLFISLGFPVKGYAYYVCALRLDNVIEREPINFLSDMLSKKFTDKATFLRLGFNNYAAVIIISSNPSQMEQYLELSGMLKEYSYSFFTETGYTLSIGVSNPVNNPADIPTQYACAIENMNISFLTGPGSIISPSIIQQNIYDPAMVKPLEAVEQILSENSGKTLINYLKQQLKLCTRETDARILFKKTIDAFYILLHKHEFHWDPQNDLESCWALINGARFADDALRYFEEAANKLIDSSGINRNQRFSPHVSAAMHYVEQNYQNNFGLDDIEKHLGIKKEYFCTCFKKETGKRFVEYITEYRIRKARNLLESTSLKLNEIALRTGFSNSYYFSLTFKKITGSSPSDYRNSHYRNPSPFS